MYFSDIRRIDGKLYVPIDEVYKNVKAYEKALTMACENTDGNTCKLPVDCSEKDCKDCCMEYYLKKARLEE